MSIKAFTSLGLLSILLSACHPAEHENHEEALTLEVTTPQRRDSTLIKEYVSQIHAIQHIEIKALERGYLQSTYVDEGQTVEMGQPMFKIMPNIYQAELDRAKAEAKAVSIEYENTKSLSDRNIVSPNELAVIKANLDKAEAEVKLAQTHLDYTDIKAPFTGKMDHLEVRTGSLLDEGELLTTFSDLSQMWVYFNVPEAEYLDYMMNADTTANAKVRLKLANGMVYPYEGTIETIEADFDNRTGNIEFRAAFPNPDMLLRHGQTGNILLDVPYPDTLLIPQKATYEILDQTFVFVVDEENRLQQRHIKIAAELPHLFIVESGLEEHDHILLEGLRRVTNGQEIHPELREATEVIASLELHAE